MNLKTTPKEAVKIIDLLVKQGADLLKLLECHEALSEFKRRRESERLKESPKYVLTTINGISKEEKPRRKDIKSYKERHSEWEENIRNALKSIYQDFSPKFQFTRIEGDYSLINAKQTPEFKAFLITTSKFEKQLSFLIAKYQELADFLTYPLFYISADRRLVYYDRVVELSPNTDETMLCDLMFEAPMGQTKTYNEIYSSLTGESEEETEKWPSNWKNKVRNAYEGVNKKTEKTFGFGVYKSKGKNMIFINIPA